MLNNYIWYGMAGITKKKKKKKNSYENYYVKWVIKTSSAIGFITNLY